MMAQRPLMQRGIGQTSQGRPDEKNNVSHSVVSNLVEVIVSEKANMNHPW
jgi:hypothetical protein